MNKMTPEKNFGFSNFGFSTIVFSFVMICVITFSVLSLVTANSDYKLSKKAADKNTAYYLAEEKACNHLYQIETILEEAYHASSDEVSYFMAVETALSNLDIGEFTNDNNEYTYCFREEISPSQTLEIALSILYPTGEKDSFFRIETWKSVFEEILPEDDLLDLID